MPEKRKRQKARHKKTDDVTKRHAGEKPERKKNEQIDDRRT